MPSTKAPLTVSPDQHFGAGGKNRARDNGRRQGRPVSPPDSTVVSVAVPPEETISVAPLDTTLPLASPPALMIAVPPPRIDSVSVTAPRAYLQDLAGADGVHPAAWCRLLPASTPPA